MLRRMMPLPHRTTRRIRTAMTLGRRQSHVIIHTCGHTQTYIHMSDAEDMSDMADRPCPSCQSITICPACGGPIAEGRQETQSGHHPTACGPDCAGAVNALSEATGDNRRSVRGALEHARSSSRPLLGRENVRGSVIPGCPCANPHHHGGISQEAPVWGDVDTARLLDNARGLAAVIAQRLAENREAQDAGTADVFGLDPTARIISWAGRYDGAV